MLFSSENILSRTFIFYHFDFVDASFSTFQLFVELFVHRREERLSINCHLIRTSNYDEMKNSACSLRSRSIISPDDYAQQFFGRIENEAFTLPISTSFPFITFSDLQLVIHSHSSSVPNR